MSLYDELGVKKDADAATIKRAHRKRVSETHPDVKGGDSEEFRKAQHAYMVLIDPERRKKYDDTGEEGEQGSRQRSPEQMEAEEANQILGALVTALINDPGVTDTLIDHTDLAKRIRDMLVQSEHGRRQELANVGRQIQRAEKMARKWRRKKAKKGEEKPDLIAAMFSAQIAALNQRVSAIQRADRINARVIALIDGYDYEHDPVATPAFVSATDALGPGFLAR